METNAYARAWEYQKHVMNWIKKMQIERLRGLHMNLEVWALYSTTQMNEDMCHGKASQGRNETLLRRSERIDHISMCGLFSCTSKLKPQILKHDPRIYDETCCETSEWTSSERRDKIYQTLLAVVWTQLFVTQSNEDKVR